MLRGIQQQERPLFCVYFALVVLCALSVSRGALPNVFAGKLYGRTLVATILSQTLYPTGRSLSEKQCALHHTHNLSTITTQTQANTSNTRPIWTFSQTISSVLLHRFNRTDASKILAEKRNSYSLCCISTSFALSFLFYPQSFCFINSLSSPSK